MGAEHEGAKEINGFKESQDISLFLDLITKYNKNPQIILKIIELINEEIMIKKYMDLKNDKNNTLFVLEGIIHGDFKLNPNIQRKLAIILLCHEKNFDNCDKLIKRFIEMEFGEKQLKKIIFDILLDYSKEFGNYAHFYDQELYKEFVNYSFEKGKYIESFCYRSYDIFQLKILYEKRDDIFNSGIVLKYHKLNN